MPEPEEKNPPAAPAATPPPVPPIEESPTFQERAKQVLGGQPTNPNSFRPITRPKPAPKVERDFNPTFDGEPEEMKEGRAAIEALREPLRQLRAALDTYLTDAQEKLATVKDTPKIKKIADEQGFSIQDATKFLAALAKADTK